jgi:hypothetical protein
MFRDPSKRCSVVAISGGVEGRLASRAIFRPEEMSGSDGAAVVCGLEIDTD